MQAPPLAKPSKKPSLERESQIVDNQYARYVRARDNGHLDYLKTAKECNDFYVGDQWDKGDKAKLEAEGRPALTINMILSTVNAVLGEHAANSVEFRYVPKAEGQEHTPNVMTKLSAAIAGANQYSWLENQVFADGIIQERGYFDMRVCFDDNLQGEVKITADDPDTIVLDPDGKDYDPSTWKEVFKTTWMSMDEIEATYGKSKRNEVHDTAINTTTFGVDSVIWDDHRNTYGDLSSMDQALAAAMNPVDDEEQRTIKLVRVIERQHVRFDPVLEFVDMVTGDTKEVPKTWDDAKIQEKALRYGLGMIRRTKKKVRWTVTADRVLLHDDWSPYKTFTKIPFFAYFRRGTPFGLVTNLRSPQEQLNKLASQELHIINTTANSGWIMWRGSLSGMTADDLRNQGAETGIVLEVNPGQQPPEKIQPNKVPAGIERAAMKSAQFIKEISGVNDAQLGFDSPEVSGVALKQKEIMGQVQMQVPFENMQRTRHYVANKMLELVQQFYTEPRAFKVATEGMDMTGEMKQKEQEYFINMRNAAGEVLNDVTVGKYEINLSVVPSRDSFQDQQLAEVLNLRNVGVFVPDDRVIEYSHLAHKQALAEEVRTIQGRGDLTEQQQQMMLFQQQIQQQMMMLEVQKAEAEVNKLLAEAQAKLASIDVRAPEYEIERERMEQELMIAREQLQLRRDLAMLQSKTTLDSDVMKLKGGLIQDRSASRMGLIQSREANQTGLQKEAMRLRNQSKGVDFKVRSGV